MLHRWHFRRSCKDEGHYIKKPEMRDCREGFVEERVGEFRGLEADVGGALTEYVYPAMPNNICPRQDRIYFSILYLA